MSKIAIIIIIVLIFVFVGLGLYYYTASKATPTVPTGGSLPDPAILVGTYKDPNNADNLTVINENGNYYIVEVNGVRHLITLKGSQLNIADWGSTWLDWDASHIGPLTKV